MFLSILSGRHPVCVALCVLAAPSVAMAGPVGYQGSLMTMGDFTESWREISSVYALTPRDAVGVQYIDMRSDDGARKREVAAFEYNRLLKRWNMPHSQANLYALIAAGQVRGNDFGGNKTMFAPGFQFDYETTRVYFAAKARAYRASGMRHDFGAALAGFSFYEVDYEQTQPWLIVEVRRYQGLSEKTEVTPMLRLIDKSWFVELGINNSRQPRFNFMVLF